MELSIRQVQRENPGMFDGDSIRRRDGEDFIVKAIARTLEQRFGLCAQQGPIEDEVGVKNSNSFNE